MDYSNPENRKHFLLGAEFAPCGHDRDLTRPVAPGRTDVPAGTVGEYSCWPFDTVVAYDINGRELLIRRPRWED